jgi:hypothetical protein
MKSLAFLLLLPTLVLAQDRSAFYGKWHGQAQYQAIVAGAPDPMAHTVTILTVALEPDGKFLGVSTENGCRLLGIASPSASPTSLNLDVTFSGCQYGGLNRRFSGFLVLDEKANYVALRLEAMKLGTGKVSASYDIKATMRR